MEEMRGTRKRKGMNDLIDRRLRLEDWGMVTKRQEGL
jgi:hypothetical protein